MCRVINGVSPEKFTIIREYDQRLLMHTASVIGLWSRITTGEIWTRVLIHLIRAAIRLGLPRILFVVVVVVVVLLLLLLLLLLLIVGARCSKKMFVVSYRIGMKFGKFVLQVNMYRYRRRIFTARQHSLLCRALY